MAWTGKAAGVIWLLDVVIKTDGAFGFQNYETGPRKFKNINHALVLHL